MSPENEKNGEATVQQNVVSDDNELYKPNSLKFWTIVVSVYSSIFLVALDRMIIATAIPSITDRFHSIEDIAWYGSAYMLTAAIFNPLCGRIYQLYSTKWVFVLSIVVFEIGSTVCGAAPSSTAFIIGRAIAGVGAAGIFCGGIMIIIPLVPLPKRPVFTSFFGIAFGVSSVLGPLVGGAFTDNSNLTWRWCFYINLPIGGLTILAIILFLNLDPQPSQHLPILEHFRRLDPVGLLFFAPSMVCLILALQWGGTTYPWSAPRIIVLLTIFAITFVAFLVVEALMPETAMAPPRITLNRTVAGSMLFVFLLSGGMMACVYYLTIWFQVAQNQSAVDAGVRTLPMLLSLVLFSIVAAMFTQKIGYYVPAMLLSAILCSVGGGLLSTLTPGSGANLWIGYQIIYGLGIGAGFQTSKLGPQTVLPPADVPLGMALSFFMQQLGGSVFLAVGQNMFSRQLVESLLGIAGLDTPVIINTGATALRSVVPKTEVDVVVHAYSYALTRVLVLTAALSAGMVIGALAVEWKSINDQKENGGQAE